MSSSKKLSLEEIKKKLTPIQFEVTQQKGTEPAFHNEYWNNKRAGIYVDIVSSEPLFSSLDKFDSGTGWPSFTKPIAKEKIVEEADNSLFVTRTEIKSKSANSHLGHVFPDGPGPNGLRFCVNSASLRFIPVEKMAEEGYGEYLDLFTTPQLEVATFAGGCFWGMEEILRKIPGVVETVVGYIGGDVTNPTYQTVKTGQTGHAEAVEIRFDSKKISYESLLHYFFRMHDPTNINRQGNDIGTQYRSAIFFHSPKQQQTAEKVKKEVEQSKKWPRPIITEIVKTSTFYPAEEYHQKYLLKNPDGYTCHYLR